MRLRGRRDDGGPWARKRRVVPTTTLTINTTYLTRAPNCGTGERESANETREREQAAGGTVMQLFSAKFQTDMRQQR